MRVHGSGGMLRLANYPFQSKTGTKSRTMVPANGHPLMGSIQEGIMAEDQAERYVHEWLYLRVVVEGTYLAHDATNKFLDEAFAFKKVEADSDSEKKLDAATDKDSHMDRKLLHNVARISLRTQLNQEVADHPTDIVVEAVLAVRNTGRGRAQI